VNPPKTPVTSGSKGIAKATTPNVCKMPGPPAPFVLTPLPNIGKSGNSPKNYTTTVEVEGCKVAIRGATFESIGDIASKGTGGGSISANTQGPTKFITPGSPNVKFEGKSVHQLGEPMLNNCAASGTPANTGATTAEDQGDQSGSTPPEFVIDMDCEKKLASGDENDKCDVEEFCAKIKGYNESKHPKVRKKPSPSNYITSKQKERFKKTYGMTDADIKAHNRISNYYTNGLRQWAKKFAKGVNDEEKGKDSPEVEKDFAAKCRYEQWKKTGNPTPPRDPPDGLQPDHVHDVGLGGPARLADIPNGIKWMNSRVNHAIGQSLKNYDPALHGDTIGTAPACKCDTA
jgi:hypothetical protein